MKRIVAAVLAVLMITAILPITAVAEVTTPVTLTVSADVNNAEEGDVVTFTVKMGAVTELPMQGMFFKLSIPQGLTYVAGSGKIADGLKEKFGAYETSFTDKTLIFVNGGGGKYTGASDITLMTFNCKVNGEVDKKMVEVTLMSDKEYPVDMIGPVQANGSIETIPTTVTGAKLFLGDCIPGDVNDDGEVDITDSVLLQRYVAGWPGIEINLAAADVNGDGEADITDSVILQRHVAAWSGYETLPIS